MTLQAQIRETVRLLQQEQRWRDQAEDLELEEPVAEIARRHLLEFVRWGQPNYQVGWFHRELCKKLEWFSREVAAGRSPRLLITAPPRHGKSEIVSRRFPVWHLGQHPDHEIVVASYEAGFAEELSADARVIRDMVADWWPLLEPKKGKKDGVELWKVEGGGSYKPVGVGGPLTGRGAHVLIIDDPIKNSEEADSQKIRDSRWRWFQSTAATRLAPGGGIIIMATRWHHDDPSGRAIKQLEDGEVNWVRLDFPAIAEKDEEFRRAGEPLHPQRWSAAYLANVKKEVGSRVWNALYQGGPTDEKGNIFKRPWLQERYHHEPLRPPKRYDQIVISVDAAFKGEEDSCPVSIQGWGHWNWVEHFLLGEVCDRMDFSTTLQSLIDFNTKLRANVILIEDKANGPALVNLLRKRLPNVLEFNPTPYGSKIVRAKMVTPTWEAGCCALPEAEFTGDYVEELVSFPLGPRKDRVDAMSQYLIWCESKRFGDGGKALTNALRGALRR